MKNFRYKTSFSSKVHCIIDEDKDKFLSKASLDNLKTIIPEEFRDQIDLLPIAFNSCNVNMGNRNGDMIDTSIALDIYKKFISRPLNIEHKRDGAFGHIVNSAFSKFNINYTNASGSELIEASEIKGKTEPFNLALSAVLYKLYNPELMAEIEESADPESKSYLSVSASWELLFDSFVLAVGSKYLQDCEIIDDPKKVEELSKNLLSMGGSGKIDGKPVFRLLRGEVSPAGIGLTNNPAGYVTGLVTIEDNDKSTNESKSSKLTTEDTRKDNQDKQLDSTANTDNLKIVKNNISHSENLNVNQDTTENININSIMKLKNLKELNDENLKECKAADITNLYDIAMKDISDKWETEKKTKEDEVKAAQDKLTEVEKSQKDLQKSLDEVKANYDKLVKANEQKEQVEVFSNRMQSLENDFDLNQEEKDILAEDIKLIDSEEAWAKFTKKTAILFKSKKKGAKPAPKKDDSTDTDDDSDTDTSKSKKAAKASINTEKTVDDALKNGEKDKEAIANAGDDKKELSLAEKAKQAFGEDGWEATPNRHKGRK